MARKSTSYNADTFGKGFALMTEGVHLFTIDTATTYYKANKPPKWELQLQPDNPMYCLAEGRAYKCWVPEDGAVESIFDAAGMDPNSVKEDLDYQPRQFEGKKIYAEVYHQKVTGDDEEVRTYANIRRPYPSFSMADQPAAPKPAAPAASTPAASPIEGTEVPF